MGEWGCVEVARPNGHEDAQAAMADIIANIIALS